MITPMQARLLMEALEVDQLFLNEEELDLLARNEPELLSAYAALRDLAESSEQVDEVNS